MAGRGKGKGRRQVSTIPSVDEDRSNAGKIRILEEKMKEQAQLLASQNLLIERQGSQITEMMNMMEAQMQKSQANIPSIYEMCPRGVGTTPETTNIIAQATATTTTATPLATSNLVVRNVMAPTVDLALDFLIKQSKIMKDSMRIEKKLKLVLHFGGRFVNDPILRYINGVEHIFNGFDPNFLSICRIEKMLEVGMICTSVVRICILEPSKTLSDGLYWVTDDDDVKIVMRLIGTSTELHVYVVDEEDADKVIPEANNGVEEENNEARQHYHIDVEPDADRSFDEAEGPDCVDGRDLGLSPDWNLNWAKEGATGYNVTRKARTSRSKSIVEINGSLNEAERDVTDVGGDAETADEHEAETTANPDYDKSSNPTFTLGMVFPDAQQLREAVDKYAITRGIQLVWVKNEPKRLRARCQPECPFVLFASGIKNEHGLKIKTLNLKHKCHRIIQNKRCTAKYLVRYFKEKICEKPNITVKEMKVEVERDLKVEVSESKCKRAKRMLIEGMDESIREKCRRLKYPKTPKTCSKNGASS